MLTIAKLGHGRIDYYLDTVAKGIEDYYAGTGEAPGTWRGAAAARLGLDGEVDGDVLRAILGGQLPGLDGPLAGGGQRRTPGWDLTFSAPKSVSVLFGLSDPDVSRQVAAAHEAAVNESLAYLERWALTSRRREGGAIVIEAGLGMIVAGFRHRTSRAGDPQLHTHALMANAVPRQDGSWGAVDSRVVYRQARSAGFVYQAVLRSQLTERLGVHWEPVDDRGIAELAEVPGAARILFSKRRHQIEAALEARGLSSARAAQVAAVRTRTAKGEVAGTDVLRARWRAEAAEVGVTSGDVHRAVGRLAAGDVRERVSVGQRRHVNDALLGPAGLTGQRTSFQRGEISQAWCQSIDPRTVGVTATTVDTLVESTIGDRRSVLLGADDPVRGLDRRRWSSEDLLAVEDRILDRVAAGRDQGVATVTASEVRRAVVHSTLSDEQQAMVTALTRDGHHIDAVVGVAGSGKTYALAVAHRLWAGAGYDVLGVAISKQAATQLQADTGITSGTLDSLLLHLDRPAAHLQAGSVVVVDEAGMVPTRKLDELLGHCAPGVKVVLVGDHRQLPEIDAGGMLRSIAERHTIATLHDNRRQHDPDERAALADVRHGDLDAGLDWYVASGRVASFDDAALARAAMIDTWWADRSDTSGSQLLMAERRVDVERLNQLARHRRADAGELDLDHVVTVDGRDFAVGDAVIFERNHRLMGVANAQRGTITALDRAAGRVTVDVGDGRLVDVAHDYLDAGHLNWGYAATVHKNQGATCDAAYLLASDRTYRELGYVALSRGRVSNRIWTVSDQEPAPTDNPAHGAETQPEPDPLVALRRAMQHSGAQQLATDHVDELEPVGIDL